jgi:hypothetical protein
MKKCALSALVGLALVTGSAGQAQDVAQSPSLGPVHHKRLCDQPMAWQYKNPQHDVPDKYKDLMGLWTGAVYFAGGGSMCIAVAVSQVTASGDVVTAFAWNLGDSPATSEALNIHSQGQANWWAKGVKAGAKGEELVFSSKDPYHGLLYEYRFSFPKEDKMVGTLIGHKLDGTTASVYAAVLTRNTFAAPPAAAGGE